MNVIVLFIDHRHVAAICWCFK